jgi:hypothetical protein
MNECDVVDMVGHVWEKLANPLSALSVLLKVPAWFNDATLILVTTATEGFYSDDLIVTALHGGLVVKRIDVTRSTIHEQEDDAFCFRCKMGLGQFSPIGSLRIAKETVP